MTEPTELVNQIKASMETMKAENAKVLAGLEASASSAGAEAKAAVKAANEAAEQISGHANRIVELEQKISSQVKAGKTAPETLGRVVIKSEAFKQFAAGSSQRLRVEANTIIGQEGSPAENSDTLVPADRQSGIVPGAFRLLRIRDVIPGGRTGSNAIEFVKEASFTNNAAERNEGVDKPESALTFTLVNQPVRTVAHFIKASKQVLDDAPMLESYIDNRMRYGVEQKIDAQMILGNGTAPALSGMTDTGNFTAFAPTTGDNALDNINRAIYAVIGADYAPSAILMNPADWGVIERTKVGTSDSRYVVGDPLRPIMPMLWGLPVVVSNNMTSGKFMVADFNRAYQVFDRTGVIVEMFEQDDNNVQKNLLTIRAEARLVLASYVPAASRFGDLVV